MKQEKCKLTVFTTRDTVKKWNLPVNQVIICRYLCIYRSCFIFFYVISIFCMGIKFRLFKCRGDFYAQVFNFAIFPQSRKPGN